MEERVSLWPIDPTEAIRLILHIDPMDLMNIRDFVPTTNRRVKCDVCGQKFKAKDTIRSQGGVERTRKPWFTCRVCWVEHHDFPLPEEVLP